MKLFLLLVVGTSMVYSKPAKNAIFSCSFDDSFLEPRYGEKQVDTNEDSFNWKDGKIPYYFSGTVTKNDKAVIHKAMKEIEKLTSCFRFQENNIEPSGHHLVIKVGYPSCIDENGMLQFGGDVLPSDSIATLTIYRQLADNPKCNNNNIFFGGVLHELMNVLGVMHTQKRIDRNETIEVNYDNIEETDDARHQYDICNHCKLYGLDYDCDSIMHYGTAQRSIGGPTMTAIDTSCKLTEWGHSSISEGDKELLKIIGQRVCSGRSATQSHNKRCEDNSFYNCDFLQERCNDPLVNELCARTCNCRGNSRVPDQSWSCLEGKDCEDAWQKTQSDCDCNQD